MKTRITILLAMTLASFLGYFVLTRGGDPQAELEETLVSERDEGHRSADRATWGDDAPLRAGDAGVVDVVALGSERDDTLSTGTPPGPPETHDSRDMPVGTSSGSPPPELRHWVDLSH